ncbi:MAG TPA: hypothetical protein VK399_14695 [Longimicrobiaceae bacterium]|nr:hypothetical protein [Longimicrobiaceae bacterium]
MAALPAEGAAGTGAPPRVHRFAPRAGNAATEALAVGIAAAVLCYVLAVQRGMQWPDSLWAALVVGVAACALFALRTRLRGQQAVEITDDALTVSSRHGAQTLPWAEVADARHTYSGGDRWVLRTNGGGPALHLVLDGYPAGEAARINGLIRERLPRGRADDGRE